MYQTILVPLDGSGRAESILGHVEALARCDDARIVLLRVLEPASPIIDPHESRVSVYLEEMSRLEQEARQYLTARQGELRALGFEVEIRLVQGPVVKTILEVAAAENADLIAMASHGRSGLAQVFYGSVALGVLHHADRPLLLVRSRSAQGAQQS